MSKASSVNESDATTRRIDDDRLTRALTENLTVADTRDSVATGERCAENGSAALADGGREVRR